MSLCLLPPCYDWRALSTNQIGGWMCVSLRSGWTNQPTRQPLGLSCCPQVQRFPPPHPDKLSWSSSLPFLKCDWILFLPGNCTAWCNTIRSKWDECPCAEDWDAWGLFVQNPPPPSWEALNKWSHLTALADGSLWPKRRQNLFTLRLDKRCDHISGTDGCLLLLLSPTTGAPWPCWAGTQSSAAADSSTRSGTARTRASGGSRGGRTRRCPTPGAAAALAQWPATRPSPLPPSGRHSAGTRSPSRCGRAGAGCRSGWSPRRPWRPDGPVRRLCRAHALPPAGPGCLGRRGAPSAAWRGSGPERWRWSRRPPGCPLLGWAPCWHRDCSRDGAVGWRSGGLLHWRENSVSVSLSFRIVGRRPPTRGLAWSLQPPSENTFNWMKNFRDFKLKTLTALESVLGANKVNVTLRYIISQ